MARRATPDTGPADILTPCTATATATACRAARMCWINRHPLEPGMAAFLDDEGLAVWAECAVHATACTDDNCDHLLYTCAAPGAEQMSVKHAREAISRLAAGTVVVRAVPPATTSEPGALATAGRLAV